MSEPISVIPLAYQNVYDSAAASTRPILPTLTVAACIIGIALQLVDTETVIASGPVVALFGIWLIIQGLKRHERLRAVLGGVHCMICALFVVMVNLWTWSPREAHVPFLVMSVVHTLVASGLVVAMWLRFSATRRAS